MYFLFSLDFIQLFRIGSGLVRYTISQKSRNNNWRKWSKMNHKCNTHKSQQLRLTSGKWLKFAPCRKFFSLLLIPHHQSIFILKDNKITLSIIKLTITLHILVHSETNKQANSTQLQKYSCRKPSFCLNLSTYQS